jgi:polyferredoxin
MGKNQRFGNHLRRSQEMGLERSHHWKVRISRHLVFFNGAHGKREERLRWKGVLTILGIILFVAGIVLAFLTFMSYIGGIMYGPFASALQTYHTGTIASVLLIIAGGLALLFSVR